MGPESGFGVKVWSFSQSLGPEFGVWVRVWGQSLESRSESEFGVKVWSFGQNLGPKSESGGVWGQSLEFESEIGVWSPSPSLGSPRPNPVMGLDWSLLRVEGQSLI